MLAVNLSDCKIYQGCHLGPTSRGFPAATMNVIPSYFHRRPKEIEITKNFVAVNSRPLIAYTRQLEISMGALFKQLPPNPITKFSRYSF